MTDLDYLLVDYIFSKKSDEDKLKIISDILNDYFSKELRCKILEEIILINVHYPH